MRGDNLCSISSVWLVSKREFLRKGSDFNKGIKPLLSQQQDVNLNKNHYHCFQVREK